MENTKSKQPLSLGFSFTYPDLEVAISQNKLVISNMIRVSERKIPVSLHTDEPAPKIEWRLLAYSGTVSFGVVKDFSLWRMEAA